MSQLLNWLSMGGYSQYVWPAYGLVFFVLIINLLGIKMASYRVFKNLSQWIKRQSGNEQR